MLSTAEVTTAEAAAVPYKNEIDADADNITFAVFTDNNSRIRKTFNAEGSAVSWWLRSPDPSSATYFRYVISNGVVTAYNASNAYSLAWGSSPCRPTRWAQMDNPSAAGIISPRKRPRVFTKSE